VADVTAEHDRYDRVTWVTIPLPPEMLRRRDRSRRFAANRQNRKRNTEPASFACQICGQSFTAHSGRAQRRGRKVYKRRFCSRACYAKSLAGNKFASLCQPKNGGDKA